MKVRLGQTTHVGVLSNLLVIRDNDFIWIELSLIDKIEGILCGFCQVPAKQGGFNEVKLKNKKTNDNHIVGICDDCKAAGREPSLVQTHDGKQVMGQGFVSDLPDKGFEDKGKLREVKPPELPPKAGETSTSPGRHSKKVEDEAAA